jgi:hypothetical protein
LRRAIISGEIEEDDRERNFMYRYNTWKVLKIEPPMFDTEEEFNKYGTELVFFGDADDNHPLLCTQKDIVGLRTRVPYELNPFA